MPVTQLTLCGGIELVYKMEGPAIWNRELDRQLECGPMPNAMAAQPNIGGALRSTPKSLADAQYLSAVQ